MANEEYKVLDSRIIDAVIAQRGRWLQSYKEIDGSYQDAVNRLLENWQGRGADAFREDTRAVQRNISGIYDILRTMCDTLSDCREVFSECDKGLDNYNRG